MCTAIYPILTLKSGLRQYTKGFISIPRYQAIFNLDQRLLRDRYNVTYPATPYPWVCYPTEKRGWRLCMTVWPNPIGLSYPPERLIVLKPDPRSRCSPLEFAGYLAVAKFPAIGSLVLAWFIMITI
jgi:hypothetical protein